MCLLYFEKNVRFDHVLVVVKHGIVSDLNVLERFYVLEEIHVGTELLSLCDEPSPTVVILLVRLDENLWTASRGLDFSRVLISFAGRLYQFDILMLPEKAPLLFDDTESAP